MTAPTLVSIQVGGVRELGTRGAADPMDRLWSSAIFKEPVEGPVEVTKTGLAGDAQADRRHHGGLDMAVLAYAADRYAAWREELGRDDFTPGAFGENLTIAGLDESTVCIGDAYRIGTARLEVSQPREPCWKLSRRWRIADLEDRVRTKGAGGWYMRVLEEGVVEAGQPVELLDRPHPDWSVSRASKIRREPGADPSATVELAACPLLSAEWKELLGPV